MSRAGVGELSGRTVLVTGGTRGIGLATGLAFAGRGASVVLTYAWGSVPEDEVRRTFEARGLPPPRLVQADVGSSADTERLVDTLRRDLPGIDVLVSNASFAATPRSLDDYDERALLQSISRSAWPLVGYARALRAGFGRWPRYLVAMSSDGPDRWSVGYDFVAASKAVLETLVRYLTWHLRDDDVRVNAIRSRGVRTASFDATFGPEIHDFVRRMGAQDRYVAPEEVAAAAVALCSGLMDAVNGQVLTIDRGTAFSDNLQRVFGVLG